MSTERDELAKVIESGYGDDPTDCPYDHAPTIADAILSQFVIIPRSELPEVTVSDHGNGFVTALAQERYQPALRVDDGEKNEGQWSRKIAYANLAIAEAMESKAVTDAAKLHAEAVAICNEVVGLPFATQAPMMNVEHWTKVALAAREIHGVTK